MTTIVAIIVGVFAAIGLLTMIAIISVIKFGDDVLTRIR